MKVIITGTTGMVGKGVLLECMDDTRITEILIINRSPLNMDHPKIKEIIHSDFSDFYPLKKELANYDGCFHCMGVSSAGMNEKKYTELTYDISFALASVLHELNPKMVFNYVSGIGTDSSEKGKIMWARVKGKTENMILTMGFKDGYMFRPGAILPERGIKSKTKLYNALYVLLKPFFFLMKRMKSVTTTTNMGQAMINLLFHPQANKHLEGAEINRLAGLK